jgi:hypothetical protein
MGPAAALQAHFLTYLRELVADGFFPALSIPQCHRTSNQTRQYNCIAWAAGDTANWWWPLSPQAYWPPWAPNEETIPAFIQAFQGLGYTQCANHLLEPAVEKIAIYADNNTPTHASRQLVTGRWSSKLGEGYDFSHTIGCMDGPLYGTAVVYIRRPRQHNLPHGAIAAVAHSFWVQEGYRHGHDKEHWLRAIQHLLEQAAAAQAAP